MQSWGQRIYRMTYERVTESSQRHRRAGPRRDQSTRGFIAARCREGAGATSESAVYPVIRRTLVRAKGNSIKAKHTHAQRGQQGATRNRQKDGDKRRKFAVHRARGNKGKRRKRGDGEGGAGGDRATWTKGNLLAGNGSGGNTVVRDFLEGRRGRGSTARRNPAVTHGRIELFIVMAGCSASLCVGVGRVRGTPLLRPDSLALFSSLTHRSPCTPSLSIYLPISIHLSFFLLSGSRSPLDFGIYKYRYQTSLVL